MEKIHLSIISEDDSQRRSLKAIFSAERNFEVVGSYSLLEAITDVIKIQPDILLIDINDNKVTRCKNVIRQIRENCPCTSIIALVNNELCESIALDLIALGIDGCLPRGLMRIYLVKSIELACLAGVFCIPSCLHKIVEADKPELSDKVVKINNVKKDKHIELKNLTKRELEILQLMVKYTNKEIAEKLYISEPTVKTHVSSVLKKLNLSNRAQVITFYYTTGINYNSLAAQS